MTTAYKLLGDGVYECQADECGQEATHVWARAAGQEELDAVPAEHRERVGSDRVSMMACPAHTVSAESQNQVHVQGCGAPGGDCVCSW